MHAIPPSLLLFFLSIREPGANQARLQEKSPMRGIGGCLSTQDYVRPRFHNFKMKNLFSVLSKYGSGQPENYLTESFVFLLQQALQRSPEIAWTIVNNLVGGRLSDAEKSPGGIEIITQLVLEDGTPDIEILMTEEFRAFIEVKHDSSLSKGQLEAYHQLLRKSSEPVKSLVLLTRSKSRVDETTLKSSEYHHVCWYEIHRDFHNLLGEDEVLDFLIKAFLDFLEEKRMSLQRISWEYEKGVLSLIDFATMLEAAILEVISDMKVQKTGGWSWRGFYLDRDNRNLFVGIRYDEPSVLVFENNGGTNPTFQRSLKFNDVHFFSLDAGDQFETIIRFVSDALDEFDAIAEE